MHPHENVPDFPYPSLDILLLNVSECEHVVTVQHALKDLGGGRK